MSLIRYSFHCNNLQDQCKVQEEGTDTKQEEAEWEIINMLFTRHGLTSLCLVKRIDLKVITKFEAEFEETERQQNVIQDLIETNHHLKDKLQIEQSPAADQEQ
ncbi:Centrosomal protein of 70 kDa [Fukomys damarensis]|uniref:Centrosomal protein of 70 kDa n=1 Tax=Fukomys damarensis TaxID=885580 RepID=A0A091DES0_FUKDA|nr:Centrosomal protein of 70 kDa [Fukomys damarensis]